MTGWTLLEAVAAPLPEADIDTDVILPARFLLRMDKDLGDCLFHARRFGPGGVKRPEFVLNRPPYDGARILVAGANFGCGSSREHAVWSLTDFGIRCVIAPSFGEIFFNNAARNGLLALKLVGRAYDSVLAVAQSAQPLAIDLPAQKLAWDGGAAGFTLNPRDRRALMQGLDEIGMILADDAADIDAFESAQQRGSPWLWR